MSPSTRRVLTVGAVLVGALVLFGPATYLVVVHAVEGLVGVAGVGTPLVGWPGLALSLLALGVALTVVTEAVAVRLSGTSALHRGGRWRRLTRHLVLSSVLVAVVAVVVDLLISVARWSLTHDRPIVFLLVAAIGVALAWAAVRAVTAFVDGLRS